MKHLRLLAFPLALAFAAACGGGEKKAQEPDPPATQSEQSGGDVTDPSKPDVPAAPATGEGDLDDEPLPNPCQGDGK